MKEIIGGNMAKVFRDKRIEAELIFAGEFGLWDVCEVWILSEADFEVLDKDEEFNYPDSWWRWSAGSTLGATRDVVMVNGKEMNAWKDEGRICDLKDEWRELDAIERAEYGTMGEYIRTWSTFEFNNLAEYLCDELGASTPKNVCALTVDLAKANKMSLGELFATYG